MRSSRGKSPGKFALWLKTLGKARHILFLLLVIILPLFNYLIYHSTSDKDAAVSLIQQLSQLLVPGLITVSSILVVRPFVEAPYRELIYQMTHQRHERLLTAVKSFAFFFSITTLVFILYLIVGFMRPAFTVALESYMIFLFALSYAVSALGKNSNLSFFVLFAFVIIGYLYQRDLPLFPFLGNTRELVFSGIFSLIWPFFIAALFLLITAERWI